MKVRIAAIVPLCLLISCLTLGAPQALFAQNQTSAVHGPSKYLYLTNEAIKPGMGTAHVKNENAAVQADREANSPNHYVGLVSITGPSHTIFFHGFDSFADLQKHHDEVMANSKLVDALRSSGAAENSLIEASLHSIYTYREDLSLRAPVDISQMRFFEISIYHVRSGHRQDWDRLVKLYMKAYESVPGAHWAMFEKMYGIGSDNTYILVVPMKSLSEVDQHVLADNHLPTTVGADQLQTMRELGSATIESSESDLFAVSPQMSYVPANWDPSFWNKN